MRYCYQRYCMNISCCQAAILNTLSIRMAVLSFFSFCATLTSEARGCKLLHKHRCAVQNMELASKEKKKVPKKKSREPKVIG